MWFHEIYVMKFISCTLGLFHVVNYNLFSWIWVVFILLNNIYMFDTNDVFVGMWWKYHCWKYLYIMYHIFLYPRLIKCLIEIWFSGDCIFVDIWRPCNGVWILTITISLGSRKGSQKMGRRYLEKQVKWS